MATVTEQRSTLVDRVWLTLVVSGQVLLAPAIAFAVTYFIDPGGILGDQPLLRVNLIPWILGAALGYGLLSLFLALAVGGWMPVGVAEKGGWAPVLGVSQRLRDVSLVDRARLHLLNSPHGKMMVIVNKQVRERGHGLLEVHGGLQILAAPLQLALVITPIIILRLVPVGWLVPNRLLELSLLVYLLALAIILRAYPRYAHRLVGPASKLRRFLVNVTRVNWMFPVLLLWLVGRTVVGVVFNWLDPDMTQWNQIAVEKRILEALLPIDIEIPETSFLDLLVALSVLPLATFTTMAVLGGGRHDLPDWLVDAERNWKDPSDEEQELLDMLDDSEEEAGDEEALTLDDAVDPDSSEGGDEVDSSDDGGDEEERGVDLAAALEAARGLASRVVKQPEPSEEASGEPDADD